MAGYMICVCASGVTVPGGNPKGIVALNGKNGDIPLEGVGPAPYLYDHHSIAQEAAGLAAVNRPYTNAEWEGRKADQWDINDSRNRTLLGGAYVGTNSPIDFQAFKNGVYQITGFTVTRTGNSGEGAAIHVDLQTLAIPTGIIIYWSLTSLNGAAQNGITPSSGSTTVTSTFPGNWPGTAARITLTPDLDNITEGAGSFVMQIRQGGTTGPIFYNSGPISVGDTSLYPYFGTTPASIDEGASGTFNVVGYHITGSATYYWSVDNASRFGTSSGSFVITNNAGSFGISPLINLQTDGATTVTVSIRATSVSGPVMATKTFLINDLSQTPAFTSPTGPVSVNEGTAQSFSVSGYTNGAASTWYWYINHGTTVAADFTGSVTDGTFTMNNGGSFSITPLADTMSDGVVSGNTVPARNETFTVSIARTNRGTAVATSPTITVNDTSLTPLNPMYWTFSSNPSNLNQTINLNTLANQGSAVYSGGPYQLGRAGNTFNVVVNSGVILRGAFSTVPGLTITGGSAVAGDILVVTVNGAVVGIGGAGGYGTAGTAGQTALDVSGVGMTSLTVNGSGTIAGGGGGGGGAVQSSTGAEGGSGAGCVGTAWNTKGSDGQRFGGCYRGGSGGAILSVTNTPYGSGESGSTVPCARASGGNQGGGGGRRWCFTGNATGRAQGGRGGVGTGAGGNAPNATTCPGGGRITAFNGGGGGGWGAAGGAGGSYLGLNYGRVGGAGGKAINSGGKTVSSSVANQWGAIG